jgi:hypothetical protein
MVARLRPRIGKKNERALNDGSVRKCTQQERGFRLKEVKIGKSGAISFAECASNTVLEDVDSKAKLVGVGLRVGGQEVTVTCAELAYDLASAREERRQRVLQLPAAGV